MKAQISLEAIVSLSLFLILLGIVLIRMVYMVQDYSKINEENIKLYSLIKRSEDVVGDWVITNFSCPDFYVKVNNITCNQAGDILIARFALCNESICEVVVG